MTEHTIHDVEVVVSCSCGKSCHAETESHAIEEWRAHVDDEMLDDEVAVLNFPIPDWRTND